MYIFPRSKAKYVSFQSQVTRTDATSLPTRNLKRKKPAYAESSSEDDTPLASSPAKPSKANGKVKKEETDSDAASKDAPSKRRASNGRASKKKLKEESEQSDDDDVALESKPRQTRKRKPKVESDGETNGKKPTKKAPPKPRGKKAVKEEEAGSETEAPKPKRARKGKKDDAEKSTAKGKGKKKEKEKEKEQEQEEVFRWWANEADPNGDGSIKWTTLEHNGVIFPPPYEPLPPNVRMKYNGETWTLLYSKIQLNDLQLGNPVELSIEAEEVAGFYAALLETDHARDPTFNRNFFEDWKTLMKKYPPVRSTTHPPF